MNYINHLNNIKSKTVDQIDQLRNDFLSTLPGNTKSSHVMGWPYGMPASIDPKIIFIGVSMGASPSSNDIEIELNGDDCLFSKIDEAKTDKKHFYYPDGRHYWDKLRLLSHNYFKVTCPDISEEDAIAMSSHFNLGTGSAGKASTSDVEPLYINWVSTLLNQKLRPDLVVLFGLKSILKKKAIRDSWNNESGLRVDWSVPKETSLNTEAYSFSEWTVTNALGHSIKIVLWPNHPSRPPFSDIKKWELAVNQYVNSDSFK
jgi:hypothetical protein